MSRRRDTGEADGTGLAGRFILWALRQRLFAGCSCDPLLGRGFYAAFGLSVVEAGLATFEDFFAALSRNITGDLGFHCPCRSDASADEKLILGFIAACQHGHELCERRIAVRLVGPDRAGLLVTRGRAFARALTRGGKGSISSL